MSGIVCSPSYFKPCFGWCQH